MILYSVLLIILFVKILKINIERVQDEHDGRAKLLSQTPNSVNQAKKFHQPK